MLGKCLGLVGLWLLSFNLLALPNEILLKNLQSRLHPLPHGGALIKSYTDLPQSYIYDQALAIMAFSRENKMTEARSLLLGLKRLQLSDGSLYFSYNLDGSSDYPAAGDKRFTGAIAWVALAASAYQQQFKEKEFVSFNHRLLEYMASLVKAKHKIKGLPFGPTDLKATAWDETEVAALEHNLDARAAYVHYSRLNGENKWNTIIADVNSFIVSLWDGDHSQFWSGMNIKNGLINKDEFYLDNQSWSVLALDDETLKKIDMAKALNLNCERLMVEHEGVVGFMDSKPAIRKSPHLFVWSEGTAGQILAMKKLKQLQQTSVACESQDEKTLLENIQKMQKTDGGIAYSNAKNHPDFSTSSSVAGTAWLYFAANDYNPFHLDHIP